MEVTVTCVAKERSALLSFQPQELGSSLHLADHLIEDFLRVLSELFDGAEPLEEAEMMV